MSSSSPKLPRTAISAATPTASQATLNVDDDDLDREFAVGAIVFQPCKITRQQRAYRVLELPHRISYPEDGDDLSFVRYLLPVEFLDITPEHTGGIHDARPAGQYRIGKVRTGLEFKVDTFRGVRDVTSLAVYPIVHHPSAGTLKHTLATRGKQWRDLCEGGIQLMKFTGLEARLIFIHYPDPAREFLSECSQVEQSDVVLDHRGYFAMNPQAKIPLGEHIKAAEGRGPQDKVCDDDWLLAPTIVYGYSVSERQWAAYDVSGDFKKHPKDSAILTDGNFAPAPACRDAPLFDISDFSQPELFGPAS